MYITPRLRRVQIKNDDAVVSNLCDEFLHVDETPEANIEICCASFHCKRKSVTCVAIVRDASNSVEYEIVTEGKGK